MAILPHEDMCTIQQGAWNMEGPVGGVVFSLSGAQACHIVLET